MRRYPFVAVAFAAMLALAACSDKPSYRMVDTSGVEKSVEPLIPDKSVVVSVPSDGSYHLRSYAGSGLEVAQNTATAFSRYAKRVEIANSGIQDKKGLLAAARSANVSYLIVPAIVHWEPRDTDWSGLPSQVDVSITVTEVETGREIRSTVLEARGAPTASVGSSIDALYLSVIGEHVAALYGTKTATGKP
jgi:hypothetical protein